MPNIIFCKAWEYFISSFENCKEHDAFHKLSEFKTFWVKSKKCICQSLEKFKNKACRTFFVYLYIDLACLSLSLSVCLYPINVKTAEPIRPKCCMGPHVTSRKNLYLKVSHFWKILKMCEKISWNPQTFCFCFILLQREDAHR